MIIRWLIYFIPSLAIEVMCYILAPLVALFIRTESRTDRVKRLGNQTITMQRDYLVRWLDWFQTFDNAVDEYWYGTFNEDSWFKTLREASQDDYDSSARLRYCCRVMWLWRNCGYGFSQYLLGRYEPSWTMPDIKEHGSKSAGFWYLVTWRDYSFQLEAQIPLSKERYYSLNIGWKPHDGFSTMMYANRIIGFRKYKS